MSSPAQRRRRVNEGPLSTAVRSAIALVLSLLLGASATAAPATGEPYEINVIIPVTGTLAALGRLYVTELNALTQMTNKAGGINGRPIAFTIGDDQSNPQIAVQLVNVLIAKHVPLIIGPSLAGTCGAVAPLLKDGPVNLCLSPGFRPTEGGYSFTPAPSSYDLAIITGKYVRQRGWKKMAFIYSTDASGQDGEQLMTRVFHQPEMSGVSVVDVEHFGVADLSVAAQVARIKASGADALFVYTSGTPCGTVLRAVHDAALDIPVLTSYSNATSEQMNAYKEFLPRELLFPGPPTMAAGQLPRGPVRDAVNAYFNAFRSLNATADPGNPTAWAAALLALDTLKHVGLNATPEQVRRYISGLHGFVGVFGTYDFTAVPQRGVDYHSGVLMTRYDPAKGTFVGVGPLGG